MAAIPVKLITYLAARPFRRRRSIRAPASLKKFGARTQKAAARGHDWGAPCPRYYRLQPHPVGTEVAQTVINRYATAAMRYADCAALIIPSLPDHMHAREIAGRLDGVLLTGTPSNVALASAASRRKARGRSDFDRDRMMIELVEATDSAQAVRLPRFSGDWPWRWAERCAAIRRRATNCCTITRPTMPLSMRCLTIGTRSISSKCGLLASAYAAPSLEVNSVHYQGIGALADSLAVERAPDGLVAAYSARPNGAPLPVAMAP